MNRTSRTTEMLVCQDCSFEGHGHRESDPREVAEATVTNMLRLGEHLRQFPFHRVVRYVLVREIWSAR